MNRPLLVSTWALVAAALILTGPGGGVWAGDEPAGFTLSNGLRVRLAPIPGPGEVVVLLGVRAGFFDEPPGFPHLAHVAEHLVFDALPEGDERKAVARWSGAGKANAETLPGWMYFDLRVDPEELEMALRVQATRLARPEFSNGLLAREVPRTLAEVEHLEGSNRFGTGKFAYSAFVQAVLHGREVIPIKAKTKEFTVGDIRLFHASTFRPDRAILCLVGDFGAPRARRAIEGAFGPIKAPRPRPDAPRDTKAGRLAAGWDAKTAHLILAWTTPPTSSREHAALTLASTTLMQRLAMDRELAAMVTMPMVTTEVEGFFLVNVQVKPGSDREALEAKVLDRIERLSTPEGFGDGEVAQAQQGFLQAVRTGGLRRMMDTLGGTSLMGRTNRELQRMGWEIAWGDLDRYAKHVEALDGAQVRDAVARHLGPARAIVVRMEPLK